MRNIFKSSRRCYQDDAQACWDFIPIKILGLTLVVLLLILKRVSVTIFLFFKNMEKSTSTYVAKFLLFYLVRCTSTGNLTFQKLENLRRSSDHELKFYSALCEVTKETYHYGGNMLKKPNVPNRKKQRSRSIDANTHYRIK